MAVAGADGPRPRGLVQLGPPRQWRHGELAGHPPEWQDVAVGDRLASTANGSTWFQVAALEHQRFLGLRALLDLRGRPFDTAGLRPHFYSDSLWGFSLEGLPGDRSRLVVSSYACSAPKLLTSIVNVLFWEPAHWIMQTRQFANLKRRAERRAARSALRSTHKVTL